MRQKLHLVQVLVAFLMNFGFAAIYNTLTLPVLYSTFCNYKERLKYMILGPYVLECLQLYSYLKYCCPQQVNQFLQY